MMSFEFNGKTYEINEPTVSQWSDVMKFKDIYDQQNLYIKMIEVITGLTREEILNGDALKIKTIGNIIFHELNRENKFFKKDVVLNGVNYSFVDLDNITFGQFVDIDTFLNKDEEYRIKNLNELAAYMYVETGLEYSKSNFKKRIEVMKELPIKYVEGALFFFLTIGKTSQALTVLYSKNRLEYQKMKLKMGLQSFGDGIRALPYYPKTKFGKLIMLLTSPLWLVLIILLSLWITIKKKIK
jgi:hypothetical protein